MRDNYKVSQYIEEIKQDRRINAIYGYIIDILSIEDQDYYIALVGPEETSLSLDDSSHLIPLDESPESLATNYGTPKDLIGLRVRVEYYGTGWRTGVARIVPPRSRQPSGNITEVPRRGFRFAIAGGGGA